MSVALYVLAVLAALFIISGVLPSYRRLRARRKRVEEFERQYVAYREARNDDYQAAPVSYGAVAEGRQARELRAWLLARRDEMQYDAQTVGKGIVYVAPPPMIGGGYKPHFLLL